MFFDGGAFLKNEGHVFERATTHTHTARSRAPRSHAFARDAHKVLYRLAQDNYPTITDSPIFWHPRLQGARSETSASSVAQERGWGVTVMGIMTQGTWTPEMRQAIQDNLISTSPLELLGAAIMLQYISDHSLWSDGGTARGIILRNDNDSACHAANS